MKKSKLAKIILGCCKLGVAVFKEDRLGDKNKSTKILTDNQTCLFFLLTQTCSSGQKVLRRCSYNTQKKVFQNSDESKNSPRFLPPIAHEVFKSLNPENS